MIHLFEVNGDELVLDVETGSLHLLDDLSAKLVKLYNENSGSRPDESLLTGLAGYTGEEISATCHEIDELIADGFLFSEALEMKLEDFYPDKPRIKAMCLHICHDCNLRCTYCFASTGDYNTGKRSFLSFETGKNAIDFLIRESGPRRKLDIDFFGGEPLLNWDVVVALTEYCKEQAAVHDKDIRLTMTTNAVLLDEEKIDYINENFVNCVLSLDGRPEIHDKMRPRPKGQGSYDIVMKKILDFAEKRDSGTYYVRGTYTRENKDFSEDIKHIASFGIKHISIEPVVGPEDASYSLREEDLPEIFDEYDRLAAYMLERPAGEKFEYFHFSIDLEGGPCVYKRLKGCGVGTEYVTVTPDGNIYPCHQLAEEEAFLMGNVNDKPVILDSAVAEKFTGLLVPQKEECNSCWAKYYCSGGCPANAYHETGSLQGIYELGCKIQKKRLETALWLKAKQILQS